ncbi:ABC transporter substrate-binding protein [Methylobacterium brachythecii]|uniref:ABC transporter substrate-binding protein n=1 Tax=Methylobacterium brachythecii TaxID=1176177 RepID=A0A7W6F585_9HYPH|nr:ABC transporter substrate-binding protein [Methylobacterium brachythecii]MBB3901072.1 NitT/TauT family transport system substrate-binding protein [Methylobacterium brachythecii]GLS45186.1 ABC transporter substrate-binding protein [Methylobacterium brachythecii]
MLSRRGLLATAALWPLPAILPARAAADVIKLGVLPFGTASWEAAVIKARRLDEANGFTLELVKLAGNDAARIAFQGNQLDTIIGDLIWAARLRSEGRNVKFLPYSTTEGAVMVPGDSPIKGLKDLSGKRLGVAGGALDKSWVLLKAQGRETGDIDLERNAQLAFGAPPLLAQKLETGELDAALLYWQFCARLEAKGFRRLISADDVMRAFGAKGAVSLIGYLFEGETVDQRPEAVKGFARASRTAKDILANEPEAWNAVRPLMAAEDDATFAVLKRDFLAGVPRRTVEAERADGEQIYTTLVRAGGEQLVGTGKTLPPNLYLDATGKG